LPWTSQKPLLELYLDHCQQSLGEEKDDKHLRLQKASKHKAYPETTMSIITSDIM
jgi:hypothetical protein